MVARWMQREHAAHLHVHFGNAGASVGVLVKRLTGCHLSYTIHGPDEFDDVPGQHLALKMQEADAVVCISQFARGQLMRISRSGRTGRSSSCAGWAWTRGSSASRCASGGATAAAAVRGPPDAGQVPGAAGAGLRAAARRAASRFT